MSGEKVLHKLICGRGRSAGRRTMSGPMNMENVDQLFYPLNIDPYHNGRRLSSTSSPCPALFARTDHRHPTAQPNVYDFYQRRPSPANQTPSHPPSEPVAVPLEPPAQPAHPQQLPDALPAPIDDEPLYVNAKQYYRILKRRVARARLEEVHRLSRQRKVRSLPLHRSACLISTCLRHRAALSSRVPPQTRHATTARARRAFPHR